MTIVPSSTLTSACAEEVGLLPAVEALAVEQDDPGPLLGAGRRRRPAPPRAGSPPGAPRPRLVGKGGTYGPDGRVGKHGQAPRKAPSGRERPARDVVSPRPLAARVDIHNIPDRPPGCDRAVSGRALAGAGWPKLPPGCRSHLYHPTIPMPRVRVAARKTTRRRAPCDGRPRRPSPGVGRPPVVAPFGRLGRPGLARVVVGTGSRPWSRLLTSAPAAWPGPVPCRPCR